MILWWLLVGCPREAPGDLPEPAAIVVPPPSLGEPIDYAVWMDPSGLQVTIPDGWTGRTGPPGSSLLATFTHTATQIVVELWSYEASGDLEPRPRPACTWDFTDTANHRLIPVLAPARTGTCFPEDPEAAVVQGWYGHVADREVHVEVAWPPGTMIEGRAALEPFLRGITAR